MDKYTPLDIRYLLFVCVVVGLFMIMLVIGDRESSPLIEEYLQIPIGNQEHANYGQDSQGTSFPAVQVEIISEVIWDQENSETEAVARFETVETNLLTPVPLLSDRFASKTPTPTSTLTPTPTTTSTPTPTVTQTPAHMAAWMVKFGSSASATPFGTSVGKLGIYMMI